MSTNTLHLVSFWQDALKILAMSLKLHAAERQGQSNACPCYPIVQHLVLDQLPKLIHHCLSPHVTQRHECPSVIADEWTLCGDSDWNMFNTTTSIMEAPFAFDSELSSFSDISPIESDLIPQPLSNIALDPDNSMDASYPSESGHLEGCNLNSEPFFDFSNGLSPELSMTPSMDDALSQTWSSYPLPQSPDASSFDGSSSCYDAQCQWGYEHTHDLHIEPPSYDIQPHAQNSSDIYPSSFCSGSDLHSPTPPWSEETKRDCTSLMDNTDDIPSLCRWDGGSCFSLLTTDKSEVTKHLQLLHGIKPGGDKVRMPCQWEGCGKEMKKESIPRHIVAVHLSNKTECGSCGKQFARLDSKLRHLKNSKREECRESESDDSRAKRRRLSLP
ncbi:uncharacterized protein EDB93DRAFT_610824 [Suillus bovinus]|uniref:uncharacterized protein n=1 Tax=Suillus bovinus TaxID=48563 RepID=UPI001B873378|nr:uncharacterized protein EDB93DRAFT_610824 [Suillus bovinus]KAG2142266.1 hypothetical protein EDB93DRAFT_610824 [Suillus bovinus]